MLLTDRTVLTYLFLDLPDRTYVTCPRQVHRLFIAATRAGATITSTTRHELVPNRMTVGAACPNGPKRLQLEHWM